MASWEKVAVILYVGDGTVKKVWRFTSEEIRKYSKETVQQSLIKLFPDIDRKGLKLKMWYTDEAERKV